MRLRGTSKTKESKYNSTVGLFISLGMLIVVFMAFDFSEMHGAGKVFLVFWVVGVCAQAYQSYRNSIFSNKSLHHEETDHDLQLEVTKARTSVNVKNSHDFAKKLRDLEQLYLDGLLTTAEYEAKRKDILDEDWGR
ncbi:MULTISPECIES: SHOCT domain-containing protein [Shewanella]|uniref:SHOCT domain-containing protein n=2 Tax=Shewanellaceae TaxID=267890 RepID=UPI003AAD5F19